MDDDEKPTVAAGARGSKVADAGAVDACLVTAAMAGASLLACWAVAFHPSNSQRSPAVCSARGSPPLCCRARPLLASALADSARCRPEEGRRGEKREEKEKERDLSDQKNLAVKLRDHR
uniref:Uncharacterized protein n=1 Tax=Oryza meridionalis TaxID=40149 RepID=A0A0E0CYB4_9ORYZ